MWYLCCRWADDDLRAEVLVDAEQIHECRLTGSLLCQLEPSRQSVVDLIIA